MNAGMYHDDRSPVGLLVESGTRRGSLITAAGPGNFGMRPNGVFCVLADGRFAVIESRAFAEPVRIARRPRKSGPMLVIAATCTPASSPTATAPISATAWACPMTAHARCSPSRTAR